MFSLVTVVSLAAPLLLVLVLLGLLDEEKQLHPPLLQLLSIDPNNNHHHYRLRCNCPACNNETAFGFLYPNKLVCRHWMMPLHDVLMQIERQLLHLQQVDALANNKNNNSDSQLRLRRLLPFHNQEERMMKTTMITTIATNSDARWVEWIP